MPFKSKRQQRFMFAAEARGEVKPGTAHEWAEETDFKKLPEKVRRRGHTKKAEVVSRWLAEALSRESA